MVVRGLGFTNGTIILEEPEAVYYSGQLVPGNVHFELNEILTYSAINLVCLGEASTQRVEVQYEMYAGENRSRQVKYEGREQYMNSVQCIAGGVGISSLPPGVHTVPFQFQVPFKAPSSFKGEDCLIWYCITAYLEYPEPRKREELVKEFKVVAPINPNILSSIMHPIELDFEEIKTCYCFCESKPIDMKITLPSGAFHVGSSIPIALKVQNDSNSDIIEICFKITKRHTYRTQQPRSEYSAPEETLVEMTKGPVFSDTRREYTWFLQLPPAVLPNLENCSIIDVAYFFKVVIRLGGCNADVEDESEIIIGVLPPTEESAVALPDIAMHLPKAPIPNPNDILAFGSMIQGQSYAPSTEIPQQLGIQTVPVLADRAQKEPYEIGFRGLNNPTRPNYAANNISGYSHMVPVGNTHYTSGQPSDNFNSSQSNIAMLPSAPPL